MLNVWDTNYYLKFYCSVLVFFTYDWCYVLTCLYSKCFAQLYLLLEKNTGAHNAKVSTSQGQFKSLMTFIVLDHLVRDSLIRQAHSCRQHQIIFQLICLTSRLYLQNMSCLLQLDMSWNCMRYIRDEFAILRKHAPSLESLNTKHNLWLKVYLLSLGSGTVYLTKSSAMSRH